MGGRAATTRYSVDRRKALGSDEEWRRAGKGNGREGGNSENSVDRKKALGNDGEWRRAGNHSEREVGNNGGSLIYAVDLLISRDLLSITPVEDTLFYYLYYYIFHSGLTGVSPWCVSPMLTMLS